jgi:hypothetical protein
VENDEDTSQDINLFKTARLKSKDGTNRPSLMLVSCYDIEFKDAILTSAKKLKDMDGCRGIYINRDLTNSQRDLKKS